MYKALYIAFSWFLVGVCVAQVPTARVNRLAPGTGDSLIVTIDFNEQTYLDPISGADLTMSGDVPISSLFKAATFDLQPADYLASNSAVYDLGGDGIADSIAIELWYYPRTNCPGAGHLIGQRGVVGNDAWALICYDGDGGNLTATFYEDGSNPIQITGNDVNNTLISDQLNHIVLQFDDPGNTAELTINDGTTTSGTVNSIYNTDIQFRVGNNTSFTLPLDGYIAHLRIWKGRLLSGSEITALYNNGEGPLSDAHLFGETAATPPPPPPAPDAPALALSSAGNQTLNYTITPAGTGGTPTSYSVKLGTATSGPYPDVRVVGLDLTPSITGLVNGTTYYAVATASNAQGESGNSNEVSGTPTDPGGGGGDFETYVAMRAAGCTIGNTYTLESSTNPKINGTFLCVDGDPLGQGDFAGIVIADSDTDWYYRQFSYGLNGPVEFDWSELSGDDDITTLITTLATVYSPNLYIRMPGETITLKMNYIDFTSYGITRLGFLEHPSFATTIEHAVSAGTGQFIYMLDYDELVLGTTTKKASRDDYNLTFVGTYTSSNKGGGVGETPALISILQRNICSGCKTYFRYNTLDAYGTGSRHRHSGRVDSLFVSGVHENSSLLMGASSATVAEDPKITDPYAHKMGWNGGAGNNLDCSKWFKHKGVFHAFGSNALYGSVEFEFNAEFGGHPISNIGTAGDPFLITVKDPGYTGSGVEMTAACILWHTLKFDGTGDDLPNKRFIKMVEGPHTYGVGNFNRIFFEASLGDDAPGCPVIKTSYITWTLVNISKNVTHIGNSVICTGDRIHHMVFKGDGVNPAMTAARVDLSDNDTVEDGTFHDIRVRVFDQGGEGGGLDNTIQNVTVTGDITMDSNVTGTTVTNVIGTSANTINASSSWTCTGEGVQGTGTVQFQNVPGAVDNLDGTHTICN